MTYRSSSEWESRFGRSFIEGESPSLCHNFQIEQYIEYQGLQFATKYDPNSLLYISKVKIIYFIIIKYNPNLLLYISKVKKNFLNLKYFAVNLLFFYFLFFLILFIHIFKTHWLF